MLDLLLLLIPRTLLGLMFLSAGLDGLSYALRGKNLFDPPLSPEGKAFLKVLKDASALWIIKSLVDIVAALMLLANFHAPLGLLLILPSIGVIMIFQLTINRAGLAVPLVLGLLTAAMIIHYRAFYASLLALQ